MVRINYARGVRKEVDDAIDFYDRSRKGLGFQFLTEVESAVESLAVQPLRYACVRGPFRRCLVNRFPYAVIFSYEQSADQIYILAVMHTSRKPDYWFPRA